MSIPLTTQALSIQNLSQPEKHVLVVLCFLSNQHNEVYRTIEKLSMDCSCSIKTIERALKKFRDEGYLEYTGKIAPKSKRIPIYRINLNHGLSGGDKSLITDSQDFKHGLSGNLNTPSQSIRIDNINKDNNKDICFSAHATSTQKPQTERTSDGLKHISELLNILGTKK